MEQVAVFWPVIGTSFAFVVWLIRLEAKVLNLESDGRNKWEKLDRMQNKLDEIAESLARLEGRLDK